MPKSPKKLNVAVKKSDGTIAKMAWVEFKKSWTPVREKRKWENEVENDLNKSISFKLVDIYNWLDKNYKPLSFKDGHRFVLSMAEQIEIWDRRAIAENNYNWELMEKLESYFLESSFEEFIVGVGELIGQISSKEDTGEKEQMILLAVYRRIFYENWIEEIINSFIGNPKFSSLINRLGWQGVGIDEEKIGDFIMLLASNGDIDFVVFQKVVGHIMDSAVLDYEVGLDRLFYGLNNGILPDKNGQDISKTVLNKIKKIPTLTIEQKTIAEKLLQSGKKDWFNSYLQMIKEQQMSFSMIGNFDAPAFIGKREDYAGWIKEFDLEQEKIYLPVGIRLARKNREDFKINNPTVAEIASDYESFIS